ncbi:unnamed protein product [Somion occarium]|uniref:ribonuclease H n=1 Tax=Somion occarium TaxID=3059160 RepID=A0ABP1CUF7_9APHY
MRGTDNQKAASPRKGWITVYCDGACKNNGKANAIAGIGVWWGPKDHRNAAERCPGAQTNNRAELIALIRVLETVPRSKTPLMIRTDSKYTIDCFREWIAKWRRNGWKTSKGEPVKNESIIRYLDALLAERSASGQEIELDYVAGHKGHEGNEGADRLANDGCLLPKVLDQDWNALEAQTRQRTAKSRSLLDDVDPVDAGAVVETIPGGRSMLAKGKEKAVESETEITNNAKIQTQPIPIPPVQLKWAAYEPIPDSWLLENSPGPSPASSASDSFSFSFGSASTSSSIHSSTNVRIPT